MDKFDLLELTEEELATFKKDFQKFLDNRSMYFSTLIQKEIAKIKDENGVEKIVYFDTPITLIKKTVKK